MFDRGKHWGRLTRVDQQLYRLTYRTGEARSHDWESRPISGSKTERNVGFNLIQPKRKKGGWTGLWPLTNKHQRKSVEHNIANLPWLAPITQAQMAPKPTAIAGSCRWSLCSALTSLLILNCHEMLLANHDKTSLTNHYPTSSQPIANYWPTITQELTKCYSLVGDHYLPNY